MSTLEAEKYLVYVKPNPKADGYAKGGYWVGDSFDSLADANAFIAHCRNPTEGLPVMGDARVFPESWRLANP